MTNIYVLNLENGKYYVGKSQNVQKRFQQHLKGYASVWTKQYKPINIIEVVKNCSDFDEDKYVKIYMSLYGIDNVRGGSYLLPELDINTKQFLQKELWLAKNLCLRCGRNNHFVKQCYFTTNVYGENIEEPATNKTNDGYKTKMIKNMVSSFINIVNEYIPIKEPIKEFIVHNTHDADNHTIQKIHNYNGEFDDYDVKKLFECKKILKKMQNELKMNFSDMKCIYLLETEIHNEKCILCGEDYDYLYNFSKRYSVFESIISNNISKLHNDKEIQDSILRKIQIEKHTKQENILMYLEDLPLFIKNVLLKSNTITVICNQIDKEITKKYEF